MAIQHDLSEQAILITGAGRGLGRSTAEKLASCGATVGLIDIDGENCSTAAAGIREAGGQAFAYATDVSNRSAFLEAAAQFARERGRIDAVVNNAMLLRYEPIEKVTDEVLDRMLAIGIKGSIWGAQILLAHMDAARGGAIVNMASPVAERGFPNTAVYSLVKGAIVTLTKTLAAELGPRRRARQRGRTGVRADTGRDGPQRQSRIRAACAHHPVAPARARGRQRRGGRVSVERGSIFHQRRNPARRRRHRRRELTPVATSAPVLHDDIFAPEAVRNARAVDDALREMAPVVKLERENITMLARYQHVSEGLKDWQAFSSRSRPWHDPNSVRPEILLTDDPPRHTAVRPVIAAALSPKALAKMATRFQRGRGRTAARGKGVQRRSDRCRYRHLADPSCTRCCRTCSGCRKRVVKT